MLVQIAYVCVGEGEAILRSSPEGVLRSVTRANGTVLFQLEREVHSAEEEYLLWLEFVAEAVKHDKAEIAEAKCDIFFRKVKNLWTTFKDIPNVALFTAWTDDMIVQVAKGTYQ